MVSHGGLPLLHEGHIHLTALAIAVEIGDFACFPNARAFQFYVGLLTSENSTGN